MVVGGDGATAAAADAAAGGGGGGDVLCGLPVVVTYQAPSRTFIC